MSIDVWRRHLLINSLLLVCLHKLLPVEESGLLCVCFCYLWVCTSRCVHQPRLAWLHITAAVLHQLCDPATCGSCHCAAPSQIIYCKRVCGWRTRLMLWILKQQGQNLYWPTGIWTMPWKDTLVLWLCDSVLLWTFTSSGLSSVAHQREIKGIKIFVPTVIKTRKGQMTSCIFLQTSKSQFERMLCASASGLWARAGRECDARTVCFLLLQASNKDLQKKITFSSDSHIFLWKTYITLWEDKQCQMVDKKILTPVSCTPESPFGCAPGLSALSVPALAGVGPGDLQRSNPHHAVTMYRN